MLRILGLSKSLGLDRVLDRADVEVPAGQVAAIDGLSGAGKTTLLRLIAGIDKPDEGRICWGAQEWVGDAVWVPPWRRPLSLVFQDFALWPHLTVAQHLEFALKGRRGIDRGKRRSIRNKWLDLLQLGQFAKRYPGELSGGQQQRVGLARALVREPALLLLDEPFSQLDKLLAERAWREITAWQRSAQATIVIVSHASEGRIASADLRFLLCSGRLELTHSGMSADTMRGFHDRDSGSPRLRVS